MFLFDQNPPWQMIHVFIYLSWINGNLGIGYFNYKLRTMIVIAMHHFLLRYYITVPNETATEQPICCDSKLFW